MAKTWYSSKMLWMNAIGIVVIIAQTQFGFIINPAAQATALLMVNMLLRTITNESIVWSKTDNDRSD